MKKLKITQICLSGYEDEQPDQTGFVFGKYFEFELTEVKTKDLLWKDSISDTGRGMEKATEQIHSILRRAGQIA